MVSCNWLHAGVLHLLFNMMALGGLGAPLERKFGTWRLATLYVTSGLFGTVVSVIFLPNVISVGASASVFGLVGACWADVFINHFGRHKWPPSFFALLVATALNLAIGLTPWVDNFMHLGGFVAGLLAGMSLFAKRGQAAPFLVAAAFVLGAEAMFHLAAEGSGAVGPHGNGRPGVRTFLNGEP